LRLRALEEAVSKLSEGITATVPDSIQSILSQDSEYENIDRGILVSLDSSPAETEKAVRSDLTLDFEPTTWPTDPIFGNICQPGPETERGRSALHRAAAAGNESMARLLLERGADMAVRDSLGQTALHVAVENEHKGVIELLLENNADLNIQDSIGRTALFHAVQAGNVEVAKKLLEVFVDTNIKDMYGNAPLHLAVEGGSEPLVLLLLKYGADINS
jgi:hypothetical protein